VIVTPEMTLGRVSSYRAMLVKLQSISPSLYTMQYEAAPSAASAGSDTNDPAASAATATTRTLILPVMACIPLILSRHDDGGPCDALLARTALSNEGSSLDRSPAVWLGLKLLDAFGPAGVLARKKSVGLGRRLNFASEEEVAADEIGQNNRDDH